MEVVCSLNTRYGVLGWMMESGIYVVRARWVDEGPRLTLGEWVSVGDQGCWAWFGCEDDLAPEECEVVSGPYRVTEQGLELVLSAVDEEKKREFARGLAEWARYLWGEHKPGVGPPVGLKRMTGGGGG